MGNVEQISKSALSLRSVHTDDSTKDFWKPQRNLDSERNLFGSSKAIEIYEYEFFLLSEILRALAKLVHLSSCMIGTFTIIVTFCFFVLAFHSWINHILANGPVASFYFCFIYLSLFYFNLFLFVYIFTTMMPSKRGCPPL